MNDLSSHPGGKRILALIDGELPPTEADPVRRHIEECAQCRREWEELGAVADSLAALAAPSASEPLRPVWPIVRDRLSRTDRPILKPAFGAAAAAAVLVGVAIGILVGSAGSRATESEGAYLWSSFGSSLAEDGGGTLSGAYSRMTIEEGGSER